MAKFNSGFTLVEITLVMAISASLLVVVLAGQRQLRSQATFDAAIDKVIASIGEARAIGVSGVNAAGAGAGTGSSYVCPGNGTPSYFQGVSWEAYPGTLLKTPAMIDVWISDNTGNAACYDPTKSVTIGTPTGLTITDISGSGPPKVAFARHNGGFSTCVITNGANPSADFSNSNSCSVGSGTTDMHIKVLDSDGNQAIITINAQTGLACRAAPTSPYACD